MSISIFKEAETKLWMDKQTDKLYNWADVIVQQKGRKGKRDNVTIKRKSRNLYIQKYTNLL